VRINWGFLLLALLVLLPPALSAQASLVFDQNPTIIRTGPGHAGINSSDWWVITAETSELACREIIGGAAVHCRIAIVVRTGSTGVVLVETGQEGARSMRGPLLRDTAPTFPPFPWTSGPIEFSGTWKYEHAFGPKCPVGHHHPHCLLPGMTIAVNDPYSGSFDFDLDGSGNPINLSVSFTLTEP
jgi:hypothetical protein